MGSDHSWKDKKITIKNNIKYIFIYLEHYKFIEKENYILENKFNNDKMQLKSPFTNCDMNKYWKENVNKYSNIYDIEFEKLNIGVDYTIAPLYLSKQTNKNNDTNDFIVFGIFLLDNNYKINKNKFTSNIYTFLSEVKPNPITTRKCDSNKYNILLGILNYKNNKCNKDNNFEDKYLILYNCKIPIKTILSNACNYLPKLEIIITTNNILQGCFKVR